MPPHGKHSWADNESGIAGTSAGAIGFITNFAARIAAHITD